MNIPLYRRAYKTYRSWKYRFSLRSESILKVLERAVAPIVICYYFVALVSGIIQPV